MNTTNAWLRAGLCLWLCGASLAPAADPAREFHATSCEGAYVRHLQGICTNDRDAIYWSWTEELVKTDLDGRLLKRIPAADHHGDLCHVAGKLYVAVNLGKFNLPAGHADSWVFVYDADTLTELARHRVPEAVHGAGGIAHRDGKFIVIGGLPEGVNENYVYEYDEQFKFRQRHVLASGYTLMGIQTVAWAEGAWWFGCYGKPKILLRADADFKLTGKWEFDASLGVVGLPDGRILIGQNTQAKGAGHKGRVVVARADKEKGLIIDKPKAESVPKLSPGTREVFMPAPKAGVSVRAFAYYTQATGAEMTSMHLHQSRSDAFDVAFARRSTDHGKTWSEPETLPTFQKVAGGTLRFGYKPGFVDEATGRMLIFGGKSLLKTDHPLEAMSQNGLTYRLSKDGGRTFYHDGPVIQARGDFNEERPLPGVIRGRNATQIGDLGSVPIRIRTGEVLMPLQITVLGADGKLANPGGGYTYHDSAVLIGKWNAQETLDWTLSARVVGDPKLTTRGMLEPTLVEAPDGRILMVMRGSNDSSGKQPGRRWHAISSDQGRTWTEPKPWGYTGGELFFSPSSCSRLIQHSSGHLFWLGNISKTNPKANSPRYPLYAGRVDPQSLQLVKDSLLIIDDRQPDDAPWMTLSNFFVYEDRATRELVVHYAAVGRPHPLAKAGAAHDWTADALRTRVTVEAGSD